MVVHEGVCAIDSAPAILSSKVVEAEVQLPYRLVLSGQGLTHPVEGGRDRLSTPEDGVPELGRSRAPCEAQQTSPGARQYAIHGWSGEAEIGPVASLGPIPATWGDHNALERPRPLTSHAQGVAPGGMCYQTNICLCC